MSYNDFAYFICVISSSPVGKLTIENLDKVVSELAKEAWDYDVDPEEIIEKLIDYRDNGKFED